MSIRSHVFRSWFSAGKTAKRVPVLEVLEQRCVLAAGDLDLGFGGDGFAATGFHAAPLLDAGNDAAVQGDGKIVLVGAASDGFGRYSPDFAVARVHADGSADPDFGIKGQVLTNFSGSFYSQETANAIVIDGSGRIVVAGRAELGGGMDFALARYLPDGSLDTSFGTGGLVTTNLGGPDDEIFDLAIDSSGNLIAAGRSRGQFALARYTDTGALDIGFDTDGMVLTDFAGSDGAHSLVILPDDRIVAAGSDGTDFAIVRYTITGALDATFAGGGKVLIDSGPTGTPGIDQLDRGISLARQSDGKLLVAGEADSDFALVRFSEDGVLDAAFGVNGFVRTDAGTLPGSFRSVAVDVGGAIFATGAMDGKVATFRYTDAGVVDVVFGTGGSVNADLGTGSDVGNAVLIAGGQLLIAGSNASSDNTVKDAALLRYALDGTPVGTFDNDGIATIDFLGLGDGSVGATLVQPDGKVIVGGAIGVKPGQADTDFALTRFNADGTLDTTFGLGGSITTGFAAIVKDGITALAFDGNKIVAVGTTGQSTRDIAIARYDSDGLLDPTFGTGGKVVTDLGGSSEDRARAVLVQPDGSIVVGGQTNFGTDSSSHFDLALVRYLVSGTLDATFGTGGVLVADLGTTDDAATAIARQSDGKLIVGASDLVGDFTLGRFTANGAIDTSFASGGFSRVDVSGRKDTLQSVVVLPDDSIVAGGSADGALGMVKWTAGGIVDAGFGLAGAVTAFPGSAIGFSVGIARQGDGKIVAALPDGNGLAVARFLSNGTIDPDFGDAGIARTSQPEARLAPRGVGLDGAGRIAVGVEVLGASGGSHMQFGAFRYEADLVPPAAGAFEFSQSAYSVLENAGTATITVKRLGGSTGMAQVSFAATAGTATSGADFDLASGMLTFADSDLEETFTVTIKTDAIAEGAETIRLALSNPTNGAALDNPHVALLTIAGEATSAGLLDPRFGVGGIAIGQSVVDRLETLGFNPEAVDAAIQTDGKILVVGTSMLSESGTREWVIERFNADGSLDTGFGGGGSSQTNFFNSLDEVSAVIALPDGKFFVVGEAGVSNSPELLSSIALVRYNADGTIDQTFGQFGKVSGDFEASPLPAAVLQPDGKIVVGGEVFTGTDRAAFFLGRYNADGTVDTTFGTNGSLLTHFTPGADDELSELLVQADGKIVAVGTSSPSGAGTQDKVAIARYHPNGTLDTSFGTGGKFVSDVGVVAYDVAQQTDGRLVIGGLRGSTAFIARLTTAGALDTTFDTDGFNTVTFPGFLGSGAAKAVSVQEDGKIMLGVTNEFFGNIGGVARFNPDGTLNTSFGTNGISTFSYDQLGTFVSAMVIQPDGKVVVAGHGTRTSVGGTVGHLALARFLADPRPGAFEFAEAAVRVDENAGAATITIARVGGADGVVTVNFATTDGTALSGSDYAATAGTLTFADGEKFKAITIPLIDNGALEGNETLTITLSAPGGGATLAQQTAAILTIFDGPGTIQFGQTVFAAGENFGTASVVLTRTGGSDGAATVNFITTDVTATANVDYLASAQTVSFADGETTKLISIPVFNDSQLEGTETVRVALSAPTGATLGSLSSATLRIFDSETGEAHNPGAPDFSWGTSGVVRTDFADDDRAADLAVQSDGRVVVLGSATQAGNTDFALARYLPDGSLDPSFGGGDGKVTTDFAGGSDDAFKVLLFGDGRILAVGQSLKAGKSDFALALYNADGTLDPNFDGDGLLTLDFGQTDDRGASASFDAEGRIVVVGSSGGVTRRDFAIARLKVSGTLDTTFSGDGLATVDFETRSDRAADVIVDGDGRVLVVGSSMGFGSTGFGANDFALARLNPDGTADKTFGTAGKVRSDFDALLDTRPENNDEAERVLLQSDGQILVGGSSDLNFLIARYTASGQLDTSYGSSGFGARLDFDDGSGFAFDELRDMVLQPDGKLVAVGLGDFGFGIARLDTEGSRDPEFGARGLFVSDTLRGEATAVAYYDARLYVAAEEESGFVTGRFLAEPASPIAGSFNFAAQSSSVAENAGTARISVTRPFYAAFGTATVDYLVTNGSARAGQDFTAVSGTLTFVEGETVKTFDVPILDDLINEGGPSSPESVQMFLFNPTGGSELGSIARARLSIADNDHFQRGQFTFSFGGYSVTEDGVNASVSVSRTGGASGTVTVEYVTTDGTAHAGEDYTFTTGALTFTNNQTFKSFMVPITDDLALEGDEKFNVTLFNPTGGATVSGGGRTGEVTIIDFEPLICSNAGALDTTFSTDGKADSGAFTLTPSSATAMARQADGKYVLVGSAGAGAETQMAVARFNADGTLDATFGTGGKIVLDLRSGSDRATEVFVLPTGKILIAGSSIGAQQNGVALVRLNANGSLDKSFSGDGKAFLDLSSPADEITEFVMQPDGRIIAAGTVFNGTDSDTVAVRFNPDGKLDPTFGVNGEFYFDRDLLDEFVVDLVLAPDGKILGSVDGLMRLNANGTLDATFGTGGFLNDAFINGIYSDLLFQPDGKLLLAKSEFQGAPIFRTAFNVSRANVDFNPDLSFGGDGSATVDFRVSAGPSRLALQSDGRILVAGGSQDFSVARLYPDGVLDIGFGSDGLALVTFGGSFEPVNGLVFESDGKITVSGNAGAGGFAVARFIGGESHGDFRIGAPTYQVDENGTSVSITVHRVCGMDDPVSVSFSTSNGTAIDGTDYEGQSGMLNWADREFGAKTVVIPIIDDEFAQGNLTFNFSLSNSQGGAELHTPDSTVVTILEDEVPGKFALSAPFYSVGEAGPFAEVIILRVDGRGGPVSVDLTATNGSAGVSDFTFMSPLQVNFADKEVSRTIQVPITDDPDFEGDESFNLALSNPLGGAALGDLFMAEVQIVDDDLPARGEFGFVATSFQINEGDGTLTLAVRRTGGAEGSVSVDVSLNGGTATAGLDFAADEKTTLFFADGETSALLTIPVIDDLAAEVSETFILTLSDPTGGATLGAKAQATLAIHDNDIVEPTTFAFTAPSFKVSEGLAQATLSVLRSGGTAGPASVTVMTSGGTAKAGKDYTATSVTVNFVDGQQIATFAIPVRRDFLDEPDEDLTLELGNPSAGTSLGMQAISTLTILDNDASALVDFNNDGHRDLILLKGAKVFLRLGDSAGGFGDPVNKARLLTELQFKSPKEFVTGDFNGDGKMDLALISAKTIGYAFGNGDGTFSAAVQLFSAKANKSLVAGDFNGDGRLDLAALAPKGVNVFLNTGSPASLFSVPLLPAFANKTPTFLVTGDFNEDNRLDVAVLNSAKKTVSLLAGNGAGGFAFPQAISIGTKLASPKQLVAADVNADSHLDLAMLVAKNQISLLSGDGRAHFVAQVIVTEKGPSRLAVGDFNDDLKLDFVTINSGKIAGIIANQGATGFSRIFRLATKIAPTGIYVSDLDHDDDPDLVLVKPEAFKIGRGLAEFDFGPV